MLLQNYNLLSDLVWQIHKVQSRLIPVLLIFPKLSMFSVLLGFTAQQSIEDIYKEY